MLIPRDAAKTALALAESFYVVSVTGPRQSGKTTLVRQVFDHKPYVSLEDPSQREFAVQDPAGFLRQFPGGAVLDEAQRVPDLFSYLQGIVDEDRQPGEFVLTGSNQFHLLSRLTQSLAGRVGMVRLLPFSYGELAGAHAAPQEIDGLLFRGSYPPLYDRHIPPSIWYADYAATYLERDVRQLVNVRDLITFQRFVRLAAAATGQLLNLSRLATDTGVSLNTAKAWLSVLEASFIVHRLPPYFANLGKRLVKSPKLYFLDSGLAAWLLGITSEEELARHPYRGALFETWVVAELLKSRYNAGLGSDLTFWRDRTGLEVDVLLGLSSRTVPVEIKAGRSVSGSDLAPLLTWRSLAGANARDAYVVYGGNESFTRSGCEIVPWHEIAHLG